MHCQYAQVRLGSSSGELATSPVSRVSATSGGEMCTQPPGRRVIRLSTYHHYNVELQAYEIKLRQVLCSAESCDR